MTVNLLATTAVHDDLDHRVSRARQYAAFNQREAALEEAALGWGLFEAHRLQEETSWLPLFEERCTPDRNCTSAILLRDHALISGLFAEVTNRNGLALVDVLADLHGALDHHDVRERRGFKGMLDSKLTEDERMELFRRHARAVQSPTVPEIRPTSDWQPTARTAITPVRAAFMQHGELGPLPDFPAPFARKIDRQLNDLDLSDRVDTLERLRKIGWMLAAATR
jgi:hypothetical protein